MWIAIVWQPGQSSKEVKEKLIPLIKKWGMQHEEWKWKMKIGMLRIIEYGPIDLDSESNDETKISVDVASYMRKTSNI